MWRGDGRDGQRDKGAPGALYPLRWLCLDILGGQMFDCYEALMLGSPALF